MMEPGGFRGLFFLLVLCLLKIKISEVTAIEVKLDGHGSRYEGEVYVRLNEKAAWAPLCAYDWDRGITSVICRQLGLGYGKVIPSRKNASEVSYTFQCKGTESSLNFCKLASSQKLCQYKKMMSLHCQPADCSGPEDSRIHCRPSQNRDLDVRLMDGGNRTNGRLEVRRGSSSWATVCDDGFDWRDARVVCRQTRLGSNGSMVQRIYGQGAGNLRLTSLDCSGEEWNLGHCGHLGWGYILDCEPEETVGVQCSGPVPTPRTTTTSTTTTSSLATPLPTSGKTSSLRILLDSPMTPKIVAQTKETLQQAGKTAALDVVLVANILQKASGFRNMSEKTANDVLTIVDSMAQLDQTVLKQSNTVGNTTNSLIAAVELLGAKVTLDREGVRRLEANSTVLQVWNLTSKSSSSAGSVLGLQLRSDGDTREVTSVDDNQSDSDMDTAIWLPGTIIQEVVGGNPALDVRLFASVTKQTGLFRAGRPTTDDYVAAGDAADTDNASSSGSQKTGRRKRRRRRRSAKEEDGKPTEGAKLGSKVISLTVTADGQPVQNLRDFGQDNVTMVFKPNNLEDLRQALETEAGVQCVFWNPELRQGHGDWSRQGCRLLHVRSDTVHCVCDHLTSFAVLMDLQGYTIPRVHEYILELITMVGLSVSVCGLSLTVLAFILVKKLHRSLPQQTLFNTALALLLAWVTFLAGIERVESHVTCVAVAMLLHYLILASFLWTLAQGVLQYVMLVKARQRPFSRYMLKAGLPAWGLPAIPVIIVSAVDVGLYNGNQKYCWMELTAFYFAFLLPVALIVAINVVIYVMVVVSICRRPNLSSTSGTSYTTISIRVSFSSFVVLGIGWIFAFFAVEKANLVLKYLFTLNAFQGFVIFLLHTARDKDVRAFCLSVRRGGKSLTQPASERTPSIRPVGTSEGSSTKETNFTRSN